MIFFLIFILKNYAFWKIKFLTPLMAAAEKETDLAKRGATLSAAESILLEEAAFLPLLFYSSKNLVSPKVQGWQANILDRHLARYMSILP